MRVRPTSPEACAKHAKSLKRSLDGLGVPTPLSAAQNALGRMHGYRTWHEMVLATRGPGRPSPQDEDVELGEIVARREHQARVLVETLGLNPIDAAKVVDGIQPTARMRPGQARDPIVAAEVSWRTLLREARNAHGFTSFDPMAWRRPDAPAGVETQMPGTSVAVLAWVEIVETAPVQGAVPVRVTAVAMDGDRPVGIVEAVGACTTGQAPENMSSGRILRRKAGLLAAIEAGFSHGEHALVSAALDLVSLHIDGGETHPYDALIRVRTWETAYGLAPKHCGLALMTAAGASILDAGYRHGGFLLDLVPAQFRGLTQEERLRRLDFRAARFRLEDYLAFGYERTPWESPGFVVHEPVREAGDSWTATSVGEPRPIKRGRFPKGFEAERSLDGFGNWKVAPHPAFWDAMPSDLVSVTVEYKGGYVIERGKQETWEYLFDLGFANGSVMRTLAMEIESFRDDGRVPKFLTVDGGAPLPENPFTGRMATRDMYRVLAANLCLLFAPREANEPNPEGRVTVRRPVR